MPVKASVLNATLLTIHAFEDCHFNVDTFEENCHFTAAIFKDGYFNDSNAEGCYFTVDNFDYCYFNDDNLEKSCYFTKPEENTRQDRKDTAVIKVKLEDQ